MIRCVATLLVCLLLASVAPAQTPAPPRGQSPAQAREQASAPPTAEPTQTPTITAVRMNDGEHITLDGRLDEPAWQRATPAGNFTQQLPQTGAPATEQTEVRFLFTKDALYMGVICFDHEPDKLLGNTMKRDEGLRAVGQALLNSTAVWDGVLRDATPADDDAPDPFDKYTELKTTWIRIDSPV